MRCVLGVVFGMAIGCSGSAEPSGSLVSGGSSVTTETTPNGNADVRRTLAKGTRTKVSLRTLPNSRCELTDPAAQRADSLRLFPDERGIVSFYGEPSPGTVETDASLSCSDGSGTRVTAAIHLDVAESTSDAVLREASERDALEAEPHADAKTLPALSLDDAMKLTEDDLRALGYPPRGTTDIASAQYQEWLQTVSKPFTSLPLHLTEDTGHFHGPAHSTGTNPPEGEGNSYWSGIILPDGATVYPYSYASAQGQWNVPEVYNSLCAQTLAEGGSYFTSSAFWVGLDGYSTGDVVQDGTDSNYMNFGGTSFYGYYAWVEYFPNSNLIISNLTVGPSSHVLFVAAAGNSTCYGAPTNGGYGCFTAVNNSTGVGGNAPPIQAPSGAPAFTGTSAEWIMENPNYASQPMADYDNATMRYPFAADFSGYTHNISTDYYIDTYIVGSGAGGIDSICYQLDNGFFYYEWGYCD